MFSLTRRALSFLYGWANDDVGAVLVGWVEGAAGALDVGFYFNRKPSKFIDKKKQQTVLLTSFAFLSASVVWIRSWNNFSTKGKDSMANGCL